MDVRRVLFMDGTLNRTERFHHSMPEREQTLAIRDQYMFRIV